MASTTPVSPKVKWAGIWASVSGLLLTGVLAILNGITPDMLAFLGAWQGVGIALVSSVAAVVAGYVTRDPLRRATLNPPLEVPPTPGV